MTGVLIVIPARYASQRLPAKLLLDRTGKPLIAHTIAAAQAVPDSEVLVATDDQRLLAAATAAGAEAVMTSPDHQSGTDRIAEAAKGRTADIVVNIQGDEPELRPETITTLIETHRSAMASERQAFASTLVARFGDLGSAREPSAVKAVLSLPDDAGVRSALYFSRSLVPFPRTGSPEPPFLHLGVYAFSMTSLQMFPGLPRTPLERKEGLEQLRILEHGHRIAVGIAAHAAIGIDTQADYDAFVRRQQGGVADGS